MGHTPDRAGATGAAYAVSGADRGGPDAGHRVIMGTMGDHLSRSEIRKDAVQSAVEAAAGTVGQVTTILTTAVRDVAGAIGGFATEIYEIRDSARRAEVDHEPGPPVHD